MAHRLAGVPGAPPPQPLPPGPTPTGTLPCLSYPLNVPRALLSLGAPWKAANTVTFYARAMGNSLGWESLAAQAIWLATGQQVARLSPAAWRALARAPIVPSAPGVDDTGRHDVEVEDGPKLPVRRAEGGVVILLGVSAWRRIGLIWVAPVFTDVKRKGCFRMISWPNAGGYATNVRWNTIPKRPAPTREARNRPDRRPV